MHVSLEQARYRLAIRARIRRFRALMADAQGTVIGFRGRRLLRFTAPFEQPTQFGRLPLNWKQWASRSRIAARLFRQEVCRMVRTPAGTYICITPAGILRKAASTFDFKIAFRDFRGTRPISLCVDGDGRVYFGEYFSNRRRESVRVFMSDDDGLTWRNVHEYEPGAIRHVHGLEYDPYRDYIWVLTGDVGTEAHIARAAPGFAQYEILLQDDQRTRVCSGVCLPNSFVFGTDAPEQQNNIFRVDARTLEASQVHKVQQSVFYTGQSCEGIFLSTVVEPSESHTTQDVHVLYSRDANHWEEVLALRRDRWRLGLFQYPAAFIAQGPQECPYVFLSMTGVRGWDGDCMVAEIACNSDGPAAQTTSLRELD